MTVKLKKSTMLEKLNLTPMIDVVFLLLIFFTIATRFESDEREMSVVLPEASEAKPRIEKPRELWINVDQDGRFILSGEPMTSKNLLTRLRQAAANNPGRQTVIIRGDERADWKFVAEVMNLCNAANIRDYRVSTATPEQTPAG